MITFKLAWRNLIGAGLRTWLNALVLSFSFVVIIWHRGFLAGWDNEARVETIAWEIGGGQYWHDQYDQYDPFTLEDSHGKLNESMQAASARGSMTPVLITQATIYPDGRMQSALLKGIPADQKFLKLPTQQLIPNDDYIPVVMGTRMAHATRLKKGDTFSIRWRDSNGTFDAAEAKVVDIFKTIVPAVDAGQLWVPLEQLQKMMRLPEEATLVVVSPDVDKTPPFDGWRFQSINSLMIEIDNIIKNKQIGGSILYIILLAMAMLAIFDTQVLSIFRRQKEIGTHIALGMTRWQVIRLFTIEGAMHGVFAAILAAIYGVPLLGLQAKYGFAMPAATDDYGLTIGERIFPAFSLGLVVGTTVVVLLTATIVSFLPTRRIAHLNPTDALRGKIS
ncbi:ABC transporter permease [candidate division KSB1 bacterium]|nr:ABC transporter permease [candidate division KSB1 bacterium]